MAASRRCLSTMKQFAEIPGPISLPLIGTLWSYLPFIGSYTFDQLHYNGAKKLEKYGPVVREEIVPGESVVWIFHPDDIHELFKKEGRFPRRRSHLAIQHIRENSENYRTGGLLPTNGSEWWRIRSSFQKELSSPRSVQTFIPQVNLVLEDFIKYLRKNQPNGSTDFLNDLSRVFLELLGSVAFDSRLKSFEDDELHEESRTSKLITAALEANSCILRTDNGPQIWRYFPTPLYTKLKNAHDHMESVAVEEIKKLLERAAPSSCLMATYLRAPNLDYRDVLGMAVDMILAGTDTTSYTTSFALYHLARHPDKQRALYEEVCTVLGENDSVDLKALAQCHYVKAVLKETLRLNPVSVGIGRVLEEDAVFSGYHVPKETVVVTQNQVSCRSSQYFKNPDEFIPERWLRGREEYESVSPYLVLPFGHGARTCIARRLAEQNIQLLLIKMVQHFSMEWCGGTLDVRSLLINKPDGPILLKLRPR